MKKFIRLITLMGALNIVTINSIMLMFYPNNKTHASVSLHDVNANLHDVNASLLKWKLSAADAKLVKNYENKIHRVASVASNNEFNNLYDNNKNQAIWSNYHDLQDALTKTKIGKENIDVNWDKMYKDAHLKDQQLQLAESEQLRFYNIFAKVFHQENVLKLIQKVGPVAVTDNTVAWTGFDPENYEQWMGYGPDFVNINLIDKQYQQGFWSSDQIISVSTHEYGHALSNFIGLKDNERETFNSNWNDLDNINSTISSDFHKAKTHSNKTILLKTAKDALKLTDGKQVLDRAVFLINYLAKQANITGNKQKLLFALIIVDSNYGRSAWNNGKYNANLDDEFFAESFARWILTPQSQRDWGWELENSFFLHYLPSFL